MIVNKENLMKIIEDVKASAWSYTSGDEKYLTNNGDVISIIGFVYEPIHEFFEPTYKLSLNGTLLYELNGGNGEDYISGIFKSEDEAFAFLENYFKNREVEVSEINPIQEEKSSNKYNKIIKCTLENNIQTYPDSYVLLDNNNDIDSELNIDLKGLAFNTDFKIKDIEELHTIKNLNELYDFCKNHNIGIDKENITDLGLLVGANKEYLISNDLQIDEREETNMDKLNIKVELRKINKEDSNLKGFADITLAGVTIKDVAVKEISTKEGKIVAFDMPNIDKYQDKEGNMKYIKSVSLNSKKDNLIPEIRKALLEALTSNETNEYGKTVINHETNIEYDKDYVKSYIRPLSFENNPYIKATSRVLVGGVLALNNVRLNEGISKEGNEFQSISVPEKKIEQEYKPLIYLDKDLREKIKDNLVTEYNKETKEQEANNEETEEDEL